MKYDRLGVAYASTSEICEILYQNPNVDISCIFAEDPDQYNKSVKEFYADLPMLKLYNSSTEDITKFDADCQNNWFMPENYKDLDIAQWTLDKCKTQEELQRVGQELLMYQERNLFPLLKQLKYIIDIWRENNIVWGVGRGSSVASYVLYLIGVHKINSIHYDLDIHEFLR